jgi:glycosyltransferase involved in cell wall biosynthesis
MGNYNKPRLLFVYPYQFGYHTDSYKYCEYLKESFDISYLCFDYGLERLILNDIQVIYMPYNTGKLNRLFRFFKYLIRYTWRERINLLFIVRFKYCFLIGLLAKAKVKILDYRSGDLSSNRLKRISRNILMRWDALFFQYISVISVGLRDLLKLDKKRTLILPLGADVISDRIKTFYRLDLLYVGTLSLRNIYQTVEGISLFLSDHNALRSLLSYTIIGFGTVEEENKIKNIVEHLGLNDLVSFVGRKRYTDLPIYFDTCNIGVAYVPITPYYQHQPVTKLFEYMLSGMPVIATGTHENRFFVNDSNGVIIGDTAEEFYKGLKEIYFRRDSFNSYEIRKYVESYTWNNIINSILKPFLISTLK